MKKFLIVIFIITLVSSSYADELSSKISGYVSNLIPGEGDTEVSIDLREDHKPDFSILAVREIKKSLDGNIFTQVSLFNTEKNNEERIIGNFGLGKRFLSNDKTLMTGFNGFLDFDDNGNSRSSIGFEAESAVLELGANYYKGLQDANSEKVLDGYDIRLASQIPHMHWADIFLDAYAWEGIDRDDIEGTKMGSEMLLTPNIYFELAYDDKDKEGLEDQWYAKVRFIHPPRSGPSLQDGFISESIWRETKNMSEELLTKVRRNNKIMVEFKGSSTISRTD